MSNIVYAMIIHMEDRQADQYKQEEVPPRIIPQTPPSPAPVAPSPMLSPEVNTKSNTPLIALIIGIALAVLVFIGVGVWFAFSFFGNTSDNGSSLASPAPFSDTSEDTGDTSPPSTSKVSEPIPDISVPAGWSRHDDEIPEAVAFFVGPVPHKAGEEYVYPSIALLVDNPSGLTITQYAEVQKELNTVIYDQYVLIDDAPVTTLEGREAHIIGGTWLSEGIPIRTKELFVFSSDNKKAYIVIGEAAAESWDEGGFDAIFDTALTSIVLPEHTQRVEGAMTDSNAVHGVMSRVKVRMYQKE